MATKRRLSGGGGATFGGGGTLPSPLSHSLAYLRRNQKGNREKRDGDQIYRRGANADDQNPVWWMTNSCVEQKKISYRAVYVSLQEREVKVQEEPQRGMAKMEDHTETKGEDDQKRGHRSDRDIPLTSRPQETSGVLTCLKCNPEPVDLLPEHPEDNLSENVQMSPVSSSSESHVICSDGDPGDVLPPWKPESHAMVFSAPIACCSLLLERLKKEVLGEDHRPKSPGSLMSGKELQHEKSSDIPSRSCSSLVSTSSRPCKQKIPLPLFLLLPGLRSPLPLTRDREPVSPSHGWKNLWIQIRGRGSSGAASSLPRGGGWR
ncbi:putative UPF0607 protein FLJ37424 isoform X3 [Neophocaena asiaeorientalis asiaeorientalis]|uniref:UPF0607 protein FLJ37424 isoform X3 n=1 Tax=Neophocaena asiaeorientalis asiaeorientalis TaxID=1706337 RepID=A0A341CCX6_NEOAA|nr:putative UPF0607 protein FLJ37424 isoform X3 [Neophocaena asiaeorientalis asiaeorientalis]